MPNIDDLMQEWPADFEEMLKEVYYTVFWLLQAPPLIKAPP